MFYLFKKGVCEMMSGSREALERECSLCVPAVSELENTEIKILEDERWLAPADLYLDARGQIAVREYEMYTQSDISVDPPVDEERLALYEAMAAQEVRLVAQETRIAEIEASLKGGDSK
jgi:hypothetical protein